MNVRINQPEEINHVTPLGLRFWDALSGQVFCEDLSVTAYLIQAPSRRTSAIMNRSGIYIFQDLPGNRESEFGLGDTEYWSKVLRKPFIIEVTDPEGRYQPFTFQVDLPFQGLFTSPCLFSPLFESSSQLGIPLYSSPTRSAPATIAVIYATLWDQPNNKPASWAMVEAYADDQLLIRSFADREGRLALLFPYPEPTNSIFSPPGSPLFGNRPSLVEQTWSIQIRAFYAPWNPIPEIPDLCQIFAQPEANLMNTVSPNSPLDEILLFFGQQLVLRSASQSTVLVVP